MVHRRIEDGTLVVGAARHLNLLQLLFPLAVSVGHHALEVPALLLGPQVGLGTLHAHRRQAHTYQQRLVATRKAQHGGGVLSINDQWYIISCQWFNGPRELCHEVHLLVVGPTLGVAVAGDDGRTLLPGLALRDLVPADTLLQVESQVTHLCVGRQGIAVQSCAIGGRQLHTDAVVEHHGVVARPHVLCPMRELHLLLLLIEHRQEGNIAQVGTSRPAEVQVAEAYYHRVAVVVARAPVPPVLTVRRS